MTDELELLRRENEVLRRQMAAMREYLIANMPPPVTVLVTADVQAAYRSDSAAFGDAAHRELLDERLYRELSNLENHPPKTD